MRGKRKERKWFTVPEVAERAVMLQVLRDPEEHAERWTLAELCAEIDDISPRAIRGAVKRLEKHGLVHSDERRLWASASAWHLDYLGMVSI